MKVLLAGPRGFCAGMDRAIEIVEMVLEGVVEDLRRRGAERGRMLNLGIFRKSNARI